MELSRRRVSIGFAALLIVAALIALWLSRPREAPQRTLPIPGENIDLQVEVLNATRVDGLARRTTGVLRRAGIDVVYFGTAREDDRDSTLILVRRGDSTAATPVVEALRAGRVLVETDSSLLLDITVLLGRDIAGTHNVRP